MKAKRMPSLVRLRELFSYDADTGIVTRIKQVPRCFIGSRAGTRNGEGALICYVDRRICYIHRIAWALYYGTEPPQIIDHINGKKTDNRIYNLREATPQQNQWNRRGKITSKSKLKGACWSSIEKKWRAAIRIDGLSVHLGWFRSAGAAHAAYAIAARKHYGEFARTT